MIHINSFVILNGDIFYKSLTDKGFNVNCCFNHEKESRINFLECLQKQNIPFVFDTWEEGEAVREVFRENLDPEYYHCYLSGKLMDTFLDTKSKNTLIQFDLNSIPYAYWCKENEKHWQSQVLENSFKPGNLTLHQNNKLFEIVTVENQTLHLKEYNYFQ